MDGGLNTYGYVGGNPINSFDPYGLTEWDGIGDISFCSYYDKLAEENPDCKYNKKAASICKGESDQVNLFTNTGIFFTYFNETQKQSEIYNNIRQKLIFYDRQSRQIGRVDQDGCTCGDTIDFYHLQSFEEVGLSPYVYGGNYWPQNRSFWPWSEYNGGFGNPVPYDRRGDDPADDFFNK